MLQSIREWDAIYLISEDHFASLSEVRGINGSQVLLEIFLACIRKFSLSDMAKLSRENPLTGNHHVR